MKIAVKLETATYAPMLKLAPLANSHPAYAAAFDVP